MYCKIIFVCNSGDGEEVAAKGAADENGMKWILVADRGELALQAIHADLWSACAEVERVWRRNPFRRPSVVEDRAIPIG
jgi:hypothetical protein